MSGRQFGGPEMSAQTVSADWGRETVRETLCFWGRSAPITTITTKRAASDRTMISNHFIRNSFPGVKNLLNSLHANQTWLHESRHTLCLIVAAFYFSDLCNNSPK